MPKMSASCPSSRILPRRGPGRGGHAGAGARDELLLVGAAQGEEQLRALVQAGADAVEHGGNVNVLHIEAQSGQLHSKATSLGKGNRPSMYMPVTISQFLIIPSKAHWMMP
jgi:hypothetical protein